jgi:hypothetical protein
MAQVKQEPQPAVNRVTLGLMRRQERNRVLVLLELYAYNTPVLSPSPNPNLGLPSLVQERTL